MQRLYPYILLSVVFASAAFAQSESIIVDETDAEFTGLWQTVKEASGPGTGTTFKFSMNVDTAATAVATFRPRIPAGGQYHVEVAWSPGGNRSSKVPCVITGADGEIPVMIDQTLKPSGWHRIAENIQFNEGTTGSVQIRNNGGASSITKIVIADAVRFVPAGPAASAGFQLLTSVPVGGHIVLDPKKAMFEANSKVKLTAQPEEGYLFSGWSGDASGSANPLEVTMDKNKRVTANFVQGNAGAILDASDAEFAGTWIPNPAKWGARTNYQYAPTCIEAGPTIATALYQPKLSKPGLYDVYIWYSKGTNRAPDAPWEIAGKDKSFTVKVNQKINGGDWFPIANGVEFEAGKKGYVKLSNVTGSLSSVVVADSVAFVYVGAR